MGRPLGIESLLEATPRRYIEESIRDVRRLKNQAESGESWSAVERLQKQERDLFRELHTLKEADRGPSSLDPELALSQIILPALATWPRPFLERLFKATAMRLGVRLDALGESEAS